MDYNLMRDVNGRIIGTLNDFYYDEESSYFDHKESDVRFPNHGQQQASPVHTYKLSSLKVK